MGDTYSARAAGDIASQSREDGAGFFLSSKGALARAAALAISMWPRGEVGAGILVISLSYGIGGPVLTVAMLSLALNLLLTGLFILIVKKLMQTHPITVVYPHLVERGDIGLLK